MSRETSKYSLELVDPNGLVLADLSGRAAKRTVTLSRNEADEIDWQIDLAELERYCTLTNQDPAVLLAVDRTEVRIKRLGKYLSGAQITYANPRLNAVSQMIEVRATGFLGLFKDRYSSAQFLAVDGADIAWQLINASQSEQYGDFGITRGDHTSVGLYNKTYSRTALKDALQELASSLTKGFDMQFTYDKKFNLYKQLGSDRPDIVFEYPGNIKELEVPNDGTQAANEIIGIGAGNGDIAQTVYTGSSIASQQVIAKRQKFLNRSATDNEDGTLTDAVNAELAAWAFPFEVPTLTIDGNKMPVSDYGIGDRVPVRISGHPLLKHIDGMYRIEKMAITVDDNDDETVVISVSI